MIAEQYLTQTEYLANERLALDKSEYFDGELFLMAGATQEHNRIKENVAIEIGYHLKGKECQSFSSDFRVHIPSNSLYAYPDVVVVCGVVQLLDDAPDTLLNPTLILEILSKSTRGYDLGDKFSLYRDVPALREYVTIDSRRLKVEVWQKSDAGVWSLSHDVADSAATFTLRSLDLTLSLRTVYDRVPGLRGPA